MRSENPHYLRVTKALERSPKRWLVTGVAGFIGSHLAERLLSLNQVVVGLDNLQTGLESNLDLLRSHKNAKSFQFWKADIREPLTIDNFDFVLHQAALASVPRSIENPQEFHETNVTGFLNVLQACVESPKKPRLVYASSSAVYGDSPHLPHKEERLGQCLSPYAATKRMNEIYAEAFANCYGLNSVGLRYFNVFGPRQDPNSPYAAVIPIWIKSLLSGEPLMINGDGSYSRDFCYVENVVQANLLAATSDIQGHDVFNVGSGRATTLLELAQILRSLASKHLESFRDPGQTHADTRRGDIAHSSADIQQASSKINYKPTFDIRDGLFETMEWTEPSVKRT
jgi:UDP-N-acetylglucosamine/UDP-N-acetylgalactosamine 4-epimerase